MKYWTVVLTAWTPDHALKLDFETRFPAGSAFGAETASEAIDHAISIAEERDLRQPSVERVQLLDETFK